MSAGETASSSDEALRALELPNISNKNLPGRHLEGRYLARSRAPAVVEARLLLGCWSAGHPVPVSGGRCILCTAFEDLPAACLDLDRESSEARTIVEVAWSLRRLASLALFDQAFAGGPRSFSAYLNANAGQTLTVHPPLRQE